MVYLLFFLTCSTAVSGVGWYLSAAEVKTWRQKYSALADDWHERYAGRKKQ